MQEVIKNAHETAQQNQEDKPLQPLAMIKLAKTRHDSQQQAAPRMTTCAARLGNIFAGIDNHTPLLLKTGGPPPAFLHLCPDNPGNRSAANAPVTLQ
ncbi:hypothetical protein B1209_21015 [Raoultella planticola]|nr:hypothetical protein B1209_21015 [Raoultella planticola]